MSVTYDREGYALAAGKECITATQLAACHIAQVLSCIAACMGLEAARSPGLFAAVQATGCYLVLLPLILGCAARNCQLSATILNSLRQIAQNASGHSTMNVVCCVHTACADVMAAWCLWLAGFGLGLICLGQGRNAPGLTDLHLEDRLRYAALLMLD